MRHHDETHTHVPSPTRSYSNERTRLWASVAVTGLGFILELVGGLMTNSLALLGDAGHMLTHFMALGISLMANIFATMPSTERKTFGFYRLEILAALANGILLVFVTGWIFVETYRRILHPPAIATSPMLVIAVIGLAANLVSAALLAGAGKGDLNIRSAVFHLAADTLSSVAVIGGGFLLMATGWLWVDPVLGFAIGLLIVFPAGKLIKESIDILLEAVPSHLDVSKVAKAIATVPGVREAHDIHIWSLTSGLYSMSAHVMTDDIRVSDSGPILAAIEKLLEQQFRIGHLTIQFECAACSGPTRGGI